MKTRILARTACGCAALLRLSFSVEERGGQNILNNPGFETGDFTGWTMYQSNHCVGAGKSAGDGTACGQAGNQVSRCRSLPGITVIAS